MPDPFSSLFFLYGLELTGYQRSNSQVKLTQWTHIAVIYDGAEIKFYINGEKDENVIRASGKIKSTTNPIHFGGDRSG
ncbi:MAG: LamG-like jellyroll fold domain-containing protein [Candidatus Neomarinimicrobiota bacterium]